MKKNFVKPEQPYKLLMTRDGVSKDACRWACAHCGTIHNSDEFAYKCCKQNHCADCGAEAYQYHTYCSKCSNHRNYEKRVANAKLVSDYDGPLFDDSSDEFWGDVDSMSDHFACNDWEAPDYVFACKVIKFKDEDPGRVADYISESLLDDYHEDSHEQLTDLNEVVEILQPWFAKQTLETWHPDYTRKIATAPIIAKAKESEQ